VDDDLDEIERLAVVFRLVDQLPADQRTVIIERYVEERSIREVAARLNRSEGAIKQLQLRALQTLRSRMEAARA
jgi:RNA polymerase sigma-70 factor (ECF subfamily)